jgi:hypothetical protein
MSPDPNQDLLTLQHTNTTPRRRQCSVMHTLAAAGLAALVLGLGWGLYWGHVHYPFPRPMALSGLVESTPWGWRLRAPIAPDRLLDLRHFARAKIIPASGPACQGGIDRLAAAWDGGPQVEFTARFRPDTPLDYPIISQVSILLELHP